MAWRGRSAVVLLLAALAPLACGRAERTGVVVAVGLGELDADELRFSLKVEGGDGEEQQIVDPDGNGRVSGPFPGGVARQPIYLDDAMAGRRARCDVMALRQNVAIAAGSGTAAVEAGGLRELLIALTALPAVKRSDSSSTAGAIPVADGGAPPEAGAPRADAGATPSNMGSAPRADASSAPHPDAGSAARPDAGTGTTTRPDGGGAKPDATAPPEPRSCGPCTAPDATGACTPLPAGTVCAPATCQNKNFVVPASTCDGAGRCASHPMVKCEKQMTCNAGACS